MSTPVKKSTRKRGLYAQKYKKPDVFNALELYHKYRRSSTPISPAAAARQHNIPAQSLRNYIALTDAAVAKSPRGAVPSVVREAAVAAVTRGGAEKLLSDEDEKALHTWINTAAQHIQPPSKTLILLKAKRLYYAAKGIEITEENEHDVMSEKWWRGFSARHPKLSTRSTTAVSAARARQTQPEIFNHFYDLLDSQYRTHGFEPSHIYALDETGVAGPQKTVKGVADKGTFNIRSKQKI